MVGRHRCYMHGGKFKVGPHEREVRPSHVSIRLRQRMFRALGISWHGGRPRKPERVLTLAEEASEHLHGQVAVLAETLPAGIEDKPIEALTPGEALGRVALSGLRQLIRIVEQPLWMEQHVDAFKQQRLIGDMSVASAKLYMRASESAFKAEQGSALVDLLKALNTAKEARGETPVPPAIENEG